MKMKKMLVMLLVASMSFSVAACGKSTTEKDDTNTMSEDEKFATELVSETWYNVSFVNDEDNVGGRMYFDEDGTGHFKNWNEVIDFQWEVKDSCMIMKYEYNGTDTESKFLLSVNQGRYEMEAESGSYLYLKESDATMKLSNARVGSQIELGTYEQDNVTEDGTEVIRWIVADTTSVSGYAILVSYYGLDVQQYHNEDVDITWENCSLRKWLNEEFYNTAFSDEEKAIISPVNLENPDNSYYKIEGGKETLDTVWMFGEYDARKYYELMSKSNGQVYTTDYVQNLGAKETDSFWLRSPGNKANKAAVAWDDSNFGEVHSPVTESHVVRPAILVSKNADVFISYDEYINYDITETEEETDSATESVSEDKSEYLTSDEASDKVADQWNLESKTGITEFYLSTSADCNSVKNLNAASLEFVRENSECYIFVVKGTFSAYDDYGTFVRSYKFDQQYEVSKKDGTVERKSLETFEN